VRHHAVLRSNAHPFDVPETHERLHGFDASESLVSSERINQAFYLKHSRQVAKQNTARAKSPPGCFDDLPRFR
jgi:hypothetical protein